MKTHLCGTLQHNTQSVDPVGIEQGLIQGGILRKKFKAEN